MDSLHRMATVSVSELPRHDLIPLVHGLFLLHPLPEGLFPLRSTGNIKPDCGCEDSGGASFLTGNVVVDQSIIFKDLPKDGLMLSSLPPTAETLECLYLSFFCKCNSLCGTEKGGGGTVDNSLTYLPLYQDKRVQ